ncbi:hypothetical protein [Morganella morganii IS15]|nr:hypothetical protein X965_15475 [Morganella sp. EGD-HP17]CDK68274.1 hypothetical protein [Morganella morganii IS15]
MRYSWLTSTVIFISPGYISRKEYQICPSLLYLLFYFPVMLINRVRSLSAEKGKIIR